ncbi:hypothetical protein RTP6_004622 [Batrachochytrium dendrobatidis]
MMTNCHSILDILRLFDNCCSKTPSNIALIASTHSISDTTVEITYAQLDSLVGVLVTQLKTIGVKRGTYVGTVLGRGLPIIALVLALWRIKAVFVPLSNLAMDRLYISKTIDSIPSLKYIIGMHNQLHEICFGNSFSTSNINMSDQIDCLSGSELCVAIDTSKTCDQESTYNEAELAYVIRTSGTTRGEKGGLLVRVPRNTLSTNVHEISLRLQLQQESSIKRFILISAPTFDPFMIELLLPLTTGSSLVIVPDEFIQTPNLLYNYIIQNRVSYFFGTPSLFLRFSRHQQFNLIMRHTTVSNIILGGESFPAQLYDLVQDCNTNHVSLWNIYGTTECSVWTSLTQIDLYQPDLLSSIHYVLDYTVMKLQDVEPDIANPTQEDKQYEIYHGGSNRICFVGDETIPKIMRPTGDLAFQNKSTGQISIIGRTNRQVKRSGYRIHLDSISHTIQAVYGVCRCEVVMLKDPTDVDMGIKSIVACVKIDKTKVEKVLAQIKDHVSSNLPFYARPDKICILDEYPVTNHGKIDYRRLEICAQDCISQDSNIHNIESNLDLCTMVRSVLEHHFSFKNPDQNVKSNTYFLSEGGTSLTALCASKELTNISVHLQSKESSLQQDILGIILHEQLDIAVVKIADLLARSPSLYPSNCKKRPRSLSHSDNGLNQSLIKTLDTTWDPTATLCYSWGRACQIPCISPMYGLAQITLDWTVDFKKCIDASPLVVFLDNTTSNSHTRLAIVGSHSGMLAAVDIDSGVVLWKRDLPDRIESSACLWTGSGHFLDPLHSLVVVGCNNGMVYGVAIIDGQIIKQFKAEEQIKSSPVVDSVTGFILVGSHDHHIYALDFSSHSEQSDLIKSHARLKWKLNLGAAVFSSPTIDTANQCVYACTLQGKMARIGMDGQLIWQVYLTDTHKPIFSSPALSPCGDTIVVGCVDGYVYGIASNSNQIWRIYMNGPVFSSPSIFQIENNCFACIGSHGNKVIIIDMALGECIYSNTTTAPMFSSPSVVASGIKNCMQIAISSIDGRVNIYVVQKTDSGLLVSRPIQMDLPGSLFSSPVWTNCHSLLQGSRSNQFHHLKIELN